MRRQSVAYFLGDVGFMADPKFRRLARRLSDADDFNSAVGAYFIALAAARRNGLPTIDVTAETDSRFVPDLIAVGLLEEGGFPVTAFVSWAPSRPPRPNETKRDELRRSVTTSDENDKSDSASPPIPSIPINSKNETDAREELDALDIYYQLTGYRPWGSWSGDELRALVNDYTDAKVQAAIVTEWNANHDRKGILKGVQARLARDAEKAKEAARSERKVRPRVVVDDAERARVAAELGRPA